MSFHYSQSTGGFYRSDIHGDAIPSDAVEISDDEHAALMEGQANGMAISSGQNGSPVLIERTKLTGVELIYSKIANLEAQVTPRRIREAVLGTDNGWLSDIDQQIAILRKQLA